MGRAFDLAIDITTTAAGELEGILDLAGQGIDAGAFKKTVKEHPELSLQYQGKPIGALRVRTQEGKLMFNGTYQALQEQMVKRLRVTCGVVKEDQGTVKEARLTGSSLEVEDQAAELDQELEEQIDAFNRSMTIGNMASDLDEAFEKLQAAADGKTLGRPRRLAH